jgi:thiamine biosynthesis lipoprotein
VALQSRWLPVSILLVLPYTAWPAIDRHEFVQVHMGLPVRIVVYADQSASDRAAQAAFARIAELDRVMSDYRPDSELADLNARAGEWTGVSAELYDVVRRATEIARRTEGAFDPSVGSLVALWREARRVQRLPSDHAIAAARARTGWHRIALDHERRAVRLEAGMRLDLGGIAKGYILQEAVRTLAAFGINRTLVEAGGDIVVGAAPPGRDGWTIDAGADALRDRAARLVHAAIATSGPTSQFIELAGVRYSHVIDPRRGLGLTSDRIAHVIAPDGATADALATAATVLGPERLAQLRSAFPEALIGFKR